MNGQLLTLVIIGCVIFTVLSLYFGAFLQKSGFTDPNEILLVPFTIVAIVIYIVMFTETYDAGYANGVNDMANGRIEVQADTVYTVQYTQ